MQKQMLLFIVALALFSGCDRKEKESGTLVQPPASASSANVPSPKVPESQTAPESAATAKPDPETMALGEKVYKSTCSICHKTGLNGAPRLGSKKDWEQRLAQGNEVLYDRAINGYRGSKGSMPSRGSNPKLSAAEVRAAVDYIVEHSIPAWSVE